MTLVILISCTLLLVTVTSASNISEQCKIHEKTTISCHCTGNEEFLLPEGYNYENVTSLRIASCTFVNLHFSSLTEASRITEIVVQNVSERLIFELFLTSKKIKRLNLSKIRRIPLITHDTFLSLDSIETLRIEDTRIDRFEERFSDLAIENSAFRNVSGSLNFAYFSTVKILRSTFQLQKPGYVLIEGDIVYMENSVFSNSSANVVAANAIKINGTCADGKSSMRLSSNYIVSANNRLPTEIIYTKNKHESERFLNQNNTVCIAGNCKCPKSSGQTIRPFNLLSTFLYLFLLFVLLLLSTSP